MKKILYVVIALVLALGGYYLVKIDKNKTGTGLKEEKATYSRSDIGLEFDYRSGPKGYVLDERIPADLGEKLLRFIILHRTEDSEKAPPANGEGAPAITIAVYSNPKKQFSRVWADNNPQFSNINLVSGQVSEAVVGGANAIRYMADGLYASENYVVAHGDNVYVFSGQFIDENSDLRRDFAPLVQSVRFIPKAGQ